MARDRFDLHTHSTASDGLLPPREVVALAAERGLGGLALTDHDTVDGLVEATGMAHALGIRCISGVEISCWSDTGELVHLLGYCFDPADATLTTLFADMRRDRLERATAIVQRVSELAGELTLDHVLNEAGSAPPGRPHIARAMVRLGMVSSVDEAFSDRWFGVGGPAWVERRGVPLGRAIDALHAAGGVAVMAHPGARSSSGVREAVVREGAALGLDGIEVDHPRHDGAAVKRCAELAVELDLVQTAGSDDHGTGVDGSRLGCRTVAVRVVEQLEQRAARRRSDARTS